MESIAAGDVETGPSWKARIEARARAAALIPIVMDLPGLAALARRVTPDPRIEQIDVDGVPVSITSPAGAGPFPAWVFVTGAHPLRRREPVVQRLAEGLARSRYVALVPDLPGLGDGQLTRKTLDAAVAVIETALRRPDVRGRVALVGASAGASIALLAAARESLGEQISVVVSIAPFADLRKILCVATTRRYADDRDYEVTTLLRRAVGRSVAAALPASPDRERLLVQLGTIEDEAHDPFDPIDPESALPDALTTPLVRLFANRDPRRFDELYEDLPPEVRSAVEELSPLAVATRVNAPVELAVPPEDPYFPFGEAEALAVALPNVRLTVTTTLDHTRPMASLGRLTGLRKFEAFVVRGLAAAAA